MVYDVNIFVALTYMLKHYNQCDFIKKGGIGKHSDLFLMVPSEIKFLIETKDPGELSCLFYYIRA